MTKPMAEQAKAEGTVTVMEKRTNTLTGFCDALSSPGPFGGGLGFPYGCGETISQPWTMAKSTFGPLVTLDRFDLTYAYAKLGLAQTLVGQPVEDAFRGGVEIESDTLDEEDIALLQKTMRTNKDWEAVKQTAKWARLFGGGGLIIVTEQDPMTPLEVDKLKPDSLLEFLSADRWELTMFSVGMAGYMEPMGYYQYYGESIDQTRAIRMLGVEAPSYIRQQLQGWGMSELERCLRSINSFVKFQNVIFELIDEAKIDIYKINQFNNSLASAEGTAAVVARVQLGNWIKNYKNALVMDKEDDFDQKQVKFQGLAAIYDEMRMNLSADLKIPMNKLFGDSSTGFGGGQDAMENYNSLLESEVRNKVHPIVDEVIKLRIQQLFGPGHEFVSAFKPLRVLTAEEEENCNDKKQARALELYDRRLLTPKTLEESLGKDGLLNVQLEQDAEPMQPTATETADIAQQQAKAGQQEKDAKGGKGGSKKNSVSLSWLRERKKLFNANRRDVRISKPAIDAYQKDAA